MTEVQGDRIEIIPSTCGVNENCVIKSPLAVLQLLIPALCTYCIPLFFGTLVMPHHLIQQILKVNISNFCRSLPDEAILYSCHASTIPLL